MAFLRKTTVLSAYKILSNIDKDKQQGLTQRVSALKYMSALDLYFNSYGKNCDLKEPTNKDVFASYVGDIIKINNDYCTKDFFTNISNNGRDFDCGSNFFSQSSVKDSKTNPYNTFLYPKRSGWKPVMDIKDQELIYRPDYFEESFAFYLISPSLRLAFIIWLLRFENIPIENVDGIKSALNNKFSYEYSKALFTNDVFLTDTSYIEFGLEPPQLEYNDILLLFSAKSTNSKRETYNNLFYPLQQIFYGAPGTGKSHMVNETTKQLPKENVFRTTFHPDSDYSTFVGCYKPTMRPTGVTLASGEKEEVITYKFVPQAFTNAYIRAWQTTEPVFLVIEEINRGNCAQIFGDLFQLLDRKDGVSEYPIKPDADLGRFIAENLTDPVEGIPDEIREGQQLALPSNLHIWATMNTSDQSLFPIDSAFKRRWEWKYIPIDTKKEDWTIKVDGTDYDWSDFLERINAKIETATSSEDKMLGFYFCKAENGIITAERFVNKVAFYLWNDVFKDYGFDDAVFNDEDGEKISFRRLYANDGKPNESMVKRFLDNLGVAGENQAETALETEQTAEP